jgi:cytochrome b
VASRERRRLRQKARHRLTPKTVLDSDRISILTWEAPHRLWHWLLAICICVSLYTGLDGGIGAMDVHIASGVTIIALLLFRLGWAIWGGRYVRFAQYRTSAAAVLRHFRGLGNRDSAHSAPGAAMAIAMFLAVAVQASSGLFASDDIVTDGPFAHLLSSSGVAVATWIHVRMCWVVLGLAATHVAALAWYALKGEPVARSMFDGLTVIPQRAILRHYWIRATFTALAAAAIVWLGSRWA